MQGIVLLAHGARDPAWAQPFMAVRDALARSLPTHAVRLAFLESMTPDLATAGAMLATDGCIAVDVVPLFLGQGGHVRKDIPAVVSALQAAHPTTRWHVHPPVGEHPAMIDAMVQVAAMWVNDSAQGGTR